MWLQHLYPFLIDEYPMNRHRVAYGSHLDVLFTNGQHLLPKTRRYFIFGLNPDPISSGTHLSSFSARVEHLFLMYAAVVTASAQKLFGIHLAASIIVRFIRSAIPFCCGV